MSDGKLPIKEGMKNLTIGRRLGAGFLIVVLTMVALVVTGVVQVNRINDKLTVINAASHNQDEHDNAMQTVLTGYTPGPVIFPNVGTVLARYRRGHSALPDAIHVGSPGLGNPMAPPAQPEQRGISAGHMGAGHNPFMIQDVEKLDEMDWLRSSGILTDRLDRRRSHGKWPKWESKLLRVKRSHFGVIGPQPRADQFTCT